MLFPNWPLLSVRHGMQFALVVLGAALGLSWNCDAEWALSGEWESVLSLKSSTDTWLMETDCLVEITVDEWSITSHSVFNSNTWKTQEFDIEATLGNFSIESDLRFEPYKDRFRDLITKVEWETDVLAFTVTTKLTRTTDWMIVEIERDWETLEIATSVRFRAPSNSCQTVFYDASLEIAFDGCGIETDLEISIDDDGFDELMLEFSDLDLIQMPWITFDFEFARTAKKTVIEFSPHVALTSILGGGSCEIEIEGACPNSPNSLPFKISEAVLTWKTGEWDLEATAILDPTNWIAKTYWFELQADVSIHLDGSRETTLESTFLWTKTDLSRSQVAVAHEISNAAVLTIEAGFNLEGGQIDRLALSLKIEP